MRSSEDLLSIAESPTRSSTAYTPTIHGRAAAAVFYDLNGFDLDPPSVDEAVDLVVAVAAGHLDLSAFTSEAASGLRVIALPSILNAWSIRRPRS